MSTSAVFTHEVGFYGWVEMASTPGASPSVSILATGGDVGLNTEPIFSTGVWGAGWYTAANQVSYAVNSMRIEGSVSFELVAGDIFNAIKSFGFDNRADNNGHILKVLPQGKAGFEGKAWCSGVSFDASENSLVTGNINYSSGDLADTNWLVGPSYLQPVGGTKLTSGSAPAPEKVYPYWGTSVHIIDPGSTHPPTAWTANDSNKMADIINWSASYSSEVNFVTLCNGRAKEDIVAPDYIMVGGMDADGSFTIFSLTDQLTPSIFHGKKSCQILLRPGDYVAGGPTNFIYLPYIVYNNASTSIQTGGTYVQADLSFTAVGDGTQPPLLLG